MLRFSPCSTDLFTLSELFSSLFFFYFTLMTLGLVRWTLHGAQSEFYFIYLFLFSFFFIHKVSQFFPKGPKDDLILFPVLYDHVER